jgi:hypothetical protein
MSLAIIPERFLLALQSDICDTVQGLTDTSGERILSNTIDSRTLQTAALLALQIATGHVVWPGTETLRIKAPKPVIGSIVVE